MISFIYEGDLVKLGGGIIIDHRVKKTPISSDFICDMYLNKKKYPCRAHFVKYGGYEISDILENKDEALDFFFEELKADNSFLFRFVMRYVLKLVINFMAIALPVFFILIVRRLDIAHIVLAVGVSVALEIILFFINGILNRI